MSNYIFATKDGLKIVDKKTLKVITQTKNGKTLTEEEIKAEEKEAKKLATKVNHSEVKKEATEALEEITNNTGEIK